ncbi:MAG: flagellar biogenesis protein FliO [Candidatus Midichloriaceae bacterium]|jgi:flagellar biogenesis protein FliO
MELSLILKAFFILILIVSLIIFTAKILKILKNKQIFTKFQNKSSIKLEEILNIDHKRRLLLVKLDKKKYLILLGQQDVLIDVINEE